MPVPTPFEIISRGAVEIIGGERLAAQLAAGGALVVKAGFDPTAPDIHLGHVVLLRKMRQFQDLGHRVVFLIGDFTARVGDPTGRNELRKKMTADDVARNAATYRDQVFRVLDPARTDIVFNSSWFGAFSAEALMELSARATVAQMLARADFRKRMDEGREISILEFLYPLLQGHDSVHLRADVELGGTDQKFNLLMGRQMQEACGQPPQSVLMMPLLEGTDGVQKMSKSLGNYVGIGEPPAEMFGKLMSIPDGVMGKYVELLTDLDLAAVSTMHPKEAKMLLAGDVVARFHGADAAAAAREGFVKVFSRREAPEDVRDFPQVSGETLVDTLVRAGAAASRNEARRLLKQGAVHAGEAVLTDEREPAPPGVVLRVGKRHFFRLRP